MAVTTEQEDRDFIKQLMQKALLNEHNEFCLINSIDGYKAAKCLMTGLKKLIKSFKKMSADVQQHISMDMMDKQTWIFGNQVEICIKFYKEELKTIADMRKEFRTYMFSNRHTLRTMLGQERSEDEMVDYRTLPWSLF